MIRWAVGGAVSLFSVSAILLEFSVTEGVVEGGEEGRGEAEGGVAGSAGVGLGVAVVAWFALVRSGAPLLLKGDLEGNKSLVFGSSQTQILKLKITLRISNGSSPKSRSSNTRGNLAL
jgi:hypothetical protein